MKQDLNTIQAEIERQNTELAEFEDALKKLGEIDLPDTFLKELEEVCEPRAVPKHETPTFPRGIRG